MLVVADTNVFINALFKENDEWCLKILAEESRGFFNFVFNDSTATELFVVTSELFEFKKYPKDKRYKTINKLIRILMRSKHVKQNTFCSLCQEDTNDNKFIGCAIDSKALYIISENGCHLNESLESIIKKQYNHAVRIVSAYQFRLLTLKENLHLHNVK